MERMETQTTSTEAVLRTVLERTAAQQASLDALIASVAELRDGQIAMQESITELQVDMASIKATAATQACRTLQGAARANHALIFLVDGSRLWTHSRRLLHRSQRSLITTGAPA
jgi:hypothetical protein